jgi:hypothetical protein
LSGCFSVKRQFLEGNWQFTRLFQFNGKTGVGLGPGGASPGYAASFDMMMVAEAVDLMVGDEGLEPPTPSV